MAAASSPCRPCQWSGGHGRPAPFRLCSGRLRNGPPSRSGWLPCDGTTQERCLTFDNLGLSADLVRTVAEEGYLAPTPVQAEAIPLVLAGRDLLAAAQTGT